MPLLTIRTNQALSSEKQQTVLSHISTVVAELLGKPERYVMTCMQDKQALLFGGSNAPCALLELKSLGLAEEKTAEYSTKLCQLIELQLAIPADRIYIEFSSPARHLWGWDGRTF